MGQARWQIDGNRIPQYFFNIYIVQSCDVQSIRIRTQQAQGMQAHLTLIINKSSSMDTLKLNLVAGSEKKEEKKTPRVNKLFTACAN